MSSLKNATAARPAVARYWPDVLAGLTVASLFIPQAMAYALLAGLPPEVGLYAATVPVAVYALFGTSRVLSIGPAAMVAVMTAAAVSSQADEGTAEYVEVAAVLAILVGAVYLVLYGARLGRIVSLITPQALIGFTTGAVMLIAASQIKHFLGLDISRHRQLQNTLKVAIENIDGVHGLTLAVALTSVVVLRLLKTYLERLPGSLVVVVLAVIASAVFDLEAHGVGTVGNIPASLPSFSSPTMDGSLVLALLPAALAIMLVGYVQSIAIAQMFTQDKPVSPSRELRALGLANVASGFFGGMPVSASFSRTAVNARAGAKSAVASLVAVGMIVLTLLVLTPAFEVLPTAALAAIIIVAVLGMIDTPKIREYARHRPSLIVMLVVALVTVAVGIEYGIVAAAIASVITHQHNPLTAEKTLEGVS